MNGAYNHYSRLAESRNRVLSQFDVGAPRGPHLARPRTIWYVANSPLQIQTETLPEIEMEVGNPGGTAITLAFGAETSFRMAHP